MCVIGWMRGVVESTLNAQITERCKVPVHAARFHVPAVNTSQSLLKDTAGLSDLDQLASPHCTHNWPHSCCLCPDWGLINNKHLKAYIKVSFCLSLCVQSRPLQLFFVFLIFLMVTNIKKYFQIGEGEIPVSKSLLPYLLFNFTLEEHDCRIEHQKFILVTETQRIIKKKNSCRRLFTCLVIFLPLPFPSSFAPFYTLSVFLFLFFLIFTLLRTHAA